MSCAHLFGGEWVRVRHVPAGNVWHQATDDLAGTDVYGTEGVDSAPWSVNFASKLPAECPYSEFLFATGDCTKWLVATTDAVIGTTYANALRPILASSDNEFNYSARWYNRGRNEDPWVSIIDHDDASAVGKMMYGENSNSHHTNSIQLGGADVYIRDPDCPSAQPSMTPSKSAQPSSEPSLVPSKSTQPSSEPSMTPSESVQPSAQPTLTPSESVQPSSQPSLMPSESIQPSSEPSSDPSSEPSSMPSCSPSSAPTESPSTKFGVNLFYPLWTNGNEGCRNDGDEPDYMAVNPTQWLSSTMQACCKKYFSGYMYDACMGRYPPDHDDCNVMLYYPDWNGSNKGCLGDGKEPYYMLSNHQYFLSNTLEECCEKFYDWDFFTCSGTTPVLTHGEFYPDWSGGGSTCLADGKIPDYMISNQNWYLSTTLEKCCDRHFYWNINECLGTTSVGSNDWYVSYEDVKCVQDCSGAEPCGGVAEPWDKLYSTKEKCCKEKLPWVPKCRFN